MPTYMESEIPTVISTNGNGYGNSGFGSGDGWWGIILLALLFGWGRNGQGGFGGGFGGGSYETMQLGRLATTNDVASGFAQNTLQRGIDDIILGQANMQNWINQGFYGIDRSVLQGFHGVDNAVCTLGYQTQTGFNSLSHQLSDCCCKTQSSIADLKYANERQTCDIISAINAGNQRIIDMYTSDKIDTLNRKLSSAEAQLSNNAQSRYIVDSVLDRLSPCPKPAFLTCNPATGLVFPQGSNGCCGCGSF